MTAPWVTVLDVGKTASKLSLCDPRGAVVARRARANAQVEGPGYKALDFAGIEDWLATTLAEFAGMAPIGVIVPVGHGAAAAIIRDGTLCAPPLDYEEAMPADLLARYLKERDPFAATGSPSMPAGLNLGAQLYRLQLEHPEFFRGAVAILPWAQYWSWRLSGVAASEVSSLGCHTDLWRPVESRASDIAVRNGWAARLAPVRRASDTLGLLSPGWVSRTGLKSDVRILCGVHDSNAALLAARGFHQISDREATVLSTGTWFVAMRTPGRGARADFATLPQERDCLMNVDVDGRPLPSARFMGGRELEILTGGGVRIDDADAQAALTAAVPRVLAAGLMAAPTFAPGVGPFPNGPGAWSHEPDDPIARGAAAALYCALVADAALDLLGARERLLIEGRFARSEVFVRALASLRPSTLVYAGGDQIDVAYGACRLVTADLAPPSALAKVAKLDMDLDRYRTAWRQRIGSQSRGGEA